MGVIGKLKVMLGLDSSEFVANAKKAQQVNEELNTSIKKTGETVNNMPASKPIIDPKQTQQATQRMGQLNMSIQQVARELPSLAMGPQMFFLAISNNLPVLTDEIARARAEYELLTKAGQKATPVWKQVISGIVSWQTALVVAITLLVAYGKDITNFFSNLFTGKKAFDAAAVAAQNFNNAMQEGRLNAVEELTKLDLLYGIATDVTETYDKRKSAVEKLQEIYPAYFASMNTEAVMAGQAVTQYNSLRDAIVETAQARAALNTITSISGDLQLLEATGDAYRDLKTSVKNATDSMKAFAESPKFSKPKTFYEFIFGADNPKEDMFNVANKQLETATENFKNELLKLSGGKELWEKIEKDFNGNVQNFEEAATRTIEKLTPKAKINFTGETVEDLNKEFAEIMASWKKAQQERQEIDKSTLAYEEAANKKEIEFLQSQQDEYGNTMVYLQRMISLLETKAQFAKSDEELTQIREETEAYREKYAAMQQASGVTPAKGSEADLRNRIRELETFIANADPIADYWKIQEAQKEILGLQEDIAKLPQNYKMTVDVDVNAEISDIEKEAEEKASAALAKLRSQSELATQISQELMATLSSTMQDSFNTLAETLGGVSDLNPREAISALLMPFADLAISAGTIIMTSGIAIESLRDALTSFLGVGAVAAGAALVAVGVAAKAGLSALAKSGGSSGSTAAGYNTYTGGYQGGYSNNGAYTSKVPDLVQAAGTNVTVDVSGSLKGEDIALAVKKVTYNKSR